MKLKSILCLSMTIACNGADLSAPHGSRLSSDQDASASSAVVVSETEVLEQPEGTPLMPGAEVSEVAIEPQAIAGAYLTCRSRGRDFENESSGVSCQYLSETGQRPSASDGRVYAFKAYDSLTQEEFTVSMLASPYPDADWYLLVKHDQAVRSLDIALRVSQQATAEELHQVKYRVPLIMAPTGLGLVGRYQNLSFGSGSYANTSGGANACPVSAQIPIVREAISIDIPMGGTNLSMDFAQLCDVGVPDIFKDYLAADPKNLLQLVQNGKVLQSWPIPAGTTEFHAKTAQGLPAGTYQLKISSGQITFKPEYAQFLGAAEYDNFGIGRMTINSNLPIKLEMAASKQSVTQEFSKFFVRAMANPVGDGLRLCANATTLDVIALKTVYGKKSLDFVMEREGELSVMLRDICDMSSANNKISIVNSMGTVVYTDVLGSVQNTEVVQYSNQIKLPAGQYTLQIQGGTYRPQNKPDSFDEFGIGRVQLQGPLKQP